MSRHPAGIDLISAGKCPKGALSPMACMVCHTGHMLECHYPMTCVEADCDHLQQAAEYMDDPFNLSEGVRQ